MKKYFAELKKRTNLLNLTGVTSYHIANLYKWFSVIDCDLLITFLDLYKINPISDERESYHDEASLRFGETISHQNIPWNLMANLFSNQVH